MWGIEAGRSPWGNSCRWRGGWGLEGGRLSGRFGDPRDCGAWGYAMEMREGLPLRAAWCLDPGWAGEACILL